MFERLYAYRLHALAFAVAALLLVIFGMGHRHSLHGFSYSAANSKPHAIDLPFLAQGRGPNTYTFTGLLERAWFGPTTYRIIPDDRVVAVEVDGKPVDLGDFASNRLHDVERGFTLDLGKYLGQQPSSITIRVQDHGGQFGLRMKASLTDWRVMLLFALAAVLAVLPLLLVFKVLRTRVAHQVAYFLVLAGSIAQVWYIFTYNPVHHIWSDPQRHWEQGTDLLRGDLMALTDPIGYQIYIAVLAKLTLKIPELVAYFTSLLALFAPWIWYRFLRELQANKTAALYGWALLSLLPSWMAIYGYFMQETLFLPLLGAALWATWRSRRKGTVQSFVLMVTLWALAGLVRGIAIPLAAVACSYLWLIQDVKLKKALFSTLVLVAILGPLTYRSYQTVGHFAPHGMGHLNVVYAKSGKKVIEIQSSRDGAQWGHGFGSPSTGAEPFQPFSDWQTQREGTVRIQVALDQGMRDWDKALESLDFDFARYLWITKENLIFAFVADSWPDNNMARLVDQIGSVTRWVWLPLFVIVLVMCAVYRRRLKHNWLLLGLLGGWFVVQILLPISVNEGRYRKPIEGLLIAQVALLIGARKNQLRAAAASPTLARQLAHVRMQVGQLLHRRNDDV